MKKCFLLSLFIFLSTFSIVNAQTKYDEFELTGPVKLVGYKLYDNTNKLAEPPKAYLFSEDHALKSIVVFYSDNTSYHFIDKLERPSKIQDKNGNITAQYNYNSEANTFEVYQGSVLKISGKLDSQGRIIELTSPAAEDKSPLDLNDNKQTKRLRILTYDKKGDQICEETFAVIESQKVAILKIDYAYNDKNQKIFERWVRVDRPGKITEKTLIYDDRGFLVEMKGLEKSTNEDLGSFTFIYDKIDDHGNWLKRRRLLNGREAMTEERLIEYYN